MLKFTFLLLLFFSFEVFSHGNETHYEKPKLDKDGFEVISEEPDPRVLSKINNSYFKKIEPIFKQKCLDCHGNGNALPWYSSIPGPKQLIQHDIKEAKKHMDMSKGFPFKGHGTPKDDLEALSKTINKETMPPFRYKIMHWNSSLTDSEKKQVQQWIKESLHKLTNPKEERK